MEIDMGVWEGNTDALQEYDRLNWRSGLLKTRERISHIQQEGARKEPVEGSFLDND